MIINVVQKIINDRIGVEDAAIFYSSGNAYASFDIVK